MVWLITTVYKVASCTTNRLFLSWTHIGRHMVDEPQIQLTKPKLLMCYHTAFQYFYFCSLKARPSVQWSSRQQDGQLLRDNLELKCRNDASIKKNKNKTEIRYNHHYNGYFIHCNGEGVSNLAHLHELILIRAINASTGLLLFPGRVHQSAS